MLGEFLLMGMLIGTSEQEIKCLADNMYHEARSQSFAGLLAVSNVVINRVEDDRYPDTICDVVKQGPTRPSWTGSGDIYPIRNKCQFSWWCDGKSDETSDTESYAQLYNLAYNIVHVEMPYLDITDGATHYHADYVTPSWAASKTRTVEIEDHIFYRWD